MTLLSSASEGRAIFRPIRSVESVRIWLILIHDLFGRPVAVLSSVGGNPARGSWLVSATAMTVPERSLKHPRSARGLAVMSARHGSRGQRE